MYVHSLSIENSSHPYQIWTEESCAFSPCLPYSRGHITPRVSLLLSCPWSLELSEPQENLPCPWRKKHTFSSDHGKISHSCTCTKPLSLSPCSWCRAAAQALCLCNTWHAATPREKSTSTDPVGPACSSCHLPPFSHCNVPNLTNTSIAL